MGLHRRWFLAVAALVLCPVVAKAWPWGDNDNEEARAKDREGQHAYAAGDYEHAAGLFRESVSLAPGADGIGSRRGSLGLSLMHLGRCEEALPILHEATEANYGIARCLAEQGNWGAAIEAARRHADTYPKEQEPILLLEDLEAGRAGHLSPQDIRNRAEARKDARRAEASTPRVKKESLPELRESCKPNPAHPKAAEIEERYEAAQVALRANLKKGKDTVWDDQLPTQQELEEGLKGRTGYVEFCAETQDASVDNLRITDQSTQFEVVSRFGRWFFIGPPLAGLPGSLYGPPGSLKELHIFARVEGTINVMGHVLPKLRLLALWNNDEYLWAEPVKAKAQGAGKSARGAP
ncbi:MAG TPA: hypothetical protein VGM51_01830 [Armatimonadota bacterium]|jgi:tetratricopeptide (TPR) repeat protein